MKYSLLGLLLLILVSSCTDYRKTRMFHTTREYHVDSIMGKAWSAEENYIIQKNDYITVQVYTNEGERIIDPNNEFARELSGQQGIRAREIEKFLVRKNGYVKLPMIGDVYLENYNLFQADSILEIKYNQFYKGVFVITRLANKRVTVLGPLGGKVIPLENDNMNVIEVIALYGGLGDRGKSDNIRLIRGELNNPEVQIINLSTIEGMKEASLDVQPNDIIYIESLKPRASERVRDVLPFISLTSSILTFIVLIGTLL